MVDVAPTQTKYPPEQLLASAAQQQLNDRNGWTAAPIITSTTTLVRTGPGVIHGVTVNSKGTVASVVRIYDGLDATGTLLGTIDSLNLSGTFLYDIGFTVGLCIVTTGSVAPNITVAYGAR